MVSNRCQLICHPEIECEEWGDKLQAFFAIKSSDWLKLENKTQENTRNPPGDTHHSKTEAQNTAPHLVVIKGRCPESVVANWRQVLKNACMRSLWWNKGVQAGIPGPVVCPNSAHRTTRVRFFDSHANCAFLCLYIKCTGSRLCQSKFFVSGK